jgi:predicted RNA-binding protein associated with RNAse of E/G family
VKLHKIKRPGGVYPFGIEQVGEDEHGVWLVACRGAQWTAPDDAGTLDFDVLVLIYSGRNYVVWWVDDPEDRRIEIDVCLPPSRTADGWSLIDLELDPIRHESGAVAAYDRDEFVDACREGWISAAEAIIAERSAREAADALEMRRPPFGDEGWQRLHAANRDT